MSEYTFRFTFDWDEEEEWTTLVSIQKDYPLCDSYGKPYEGSSWLREELSNVGIPDFLGREEVVGLPTGRYKCEATIEVWTDYYGESDVSSGAEWIKPANRATKRAMKRKEEALKSESVSV